MTYKAIVERMVEIKASGFVEKTLFNHGIDFLYTTPLETTMENDKEEDTIFWEVKVGIRSRTSSATVIVGGTADSHCFICPSVIWDENKKNILWLAVEQTRKELGITEFKIAI